MQITQDDLWKRLVDANLAIIGINTTTNKLVRYSDSVMVGETGQGSFILYPVNRKKAVRSQLNTTLTAMFSDCDNVTVTKGTKPIVASPAR